ncbi:MAG: phosphatase PAP2 family protein [candidate division KSB1 bacterium]|nr:phosphatase PAP2 family protein [candidate division KSB1 bacterium]MDZ7366830.1 phosphatase PAP2 family protein [candidate division KSB1 bacterium]MDZ7405163.1 phosphatase PAP2 family protein [candidate division KSB1 bacterium]
MTLKNFWTHLRLYDRLTFGYLWLTLLLAAFSPKPLPIRGRILLSHLIISVVVVLLIYWGQLRSQTHRPYIPPGWLQFLRDWHPLFWFTFFLFGEFTHLANLIFPYWIEKHLIQFDLWLFGQPAHMFFAKNLPPWSVEIAAFAYWSYYPIIFGIAVWYYFFHFNDGKSHPAFVGFMNRLCLAFYVCYVLFMIVPARSPRHALNLNEQLNFAGGLFYHMIATLQNYVSVVGAAFPSSHVAVAWVAVLTLRNDHRVAFWSLIPLVIALTMSIFLLQYHYVLDAVFGVLLAAAFEWLWRRAYFKKASFATTPLPPLLVTEPSPNSLT